MNRNEMLPVNSYTALKDFNLAEAISDELSGMDVSFDRVTIPAAGGTAFELPGELPGETEAAKEFSGVILYHHPLFTYYRERFTGGNSAPDCGSYDGVTGVGDPGGSCAHCLLNQFGSGENIAYSQAQFAVARLLTEEELPYIAAMAEQVKGFATRVGYEVEAVSAEAIDPETGEILPPLA